MTILALAQDSIQLVPDGTLLVHVLWILIMVGVLNVTLFRPIRSILADRERLGSSGHGEAAKVLAETEAKLSEYEHRLRDARVAGYQLLEQERSAATKGREGQLASLREEIRNQVMVEKGEIGRQAEAARGTLKTDAKEMAGRLATTILGRPVA